MKHINKYTDQTAYEADANRPKDEPTVSKIGKSIKYDKGENLIMDGHFSGNGDTVVYDTVDKRMKVVKLGSLNTSTLSNRYIIGGTVYNRNNTEVQFVCNDDIGSRQWAHPWRAKLSGFSASGGSFTITFNSSTTPAITYTADDTLADIAAKIDTALKVFLDKLTATAYGDYIVVEQNWYTPVISTFTATEITVEILTGNYQTELSGLVDSYYSVRMNNGIAHSNAGMNLERFIAYYSASGSDDVNVSIPTTIKVNESKFNMTDNPILVDHYVTYREYMKDMMIKYPYSKDAISDRDGKLNTNILGSVMFTDHDGAEAPAYPACYAALNYGIETIGEQTGFEKGNWWLPAPPEMNTLIKDVTVGVSGFETDDVNKGIADAGGYPINATHYFWTPTERSSYVSWYYSGYNGFLYHNLKTNRARVRVVSAFPLLQS